MESGSFVRILFVLYCIEAGVLLLLAPWSPSWDRVVTRIPSFALQGLLFHPVFRGAVSGFGLVHLVWGVHDLDRWLVRRRLRERSTT
jgi:hypothetical protein